MLGAARCVFMAEQAQAGPLSLGALPAFESSRVQVTALPGWPAGRTPKAVVAQGSCAHGFVRRPWKPTDNDGSFMDVQAGWKSNDGALDTITIELDDATQLDIVYQVQDQIPTPGQGGTTRILDAAASGGHDYTDWTTAIAALQAGDVLVVRARAGGGVYNVDVDSGGPSSSVDDVTVVADPADIAAGRRPRIHLQGGQFAPFHDSPSGLWEPDPGAPANTAWRTANSSYADPGEAVGGLYRTAAGEWKRLYTYTNTAAGQALNRLRDTTYARMTKGSPSPENWNTYLGPGIYFEGGRYYIRLDPVPPETVNNPAGAAPTPYPWDWDAYHPAATDPNNVQLLLSSTDAELAPHNHCLDISDTSGWRIRNLDFVGGGGAIKCKNVVADPLLEGCRFFGLAMPEAFEGLTDGVSFVADYLDADGAVLVADRCEFWGGWAPWGTWAELKGHWGAYGVSLRQRLASAVGSGTSLVFRHCLIDGFVHTFWHPTSTGTMKFHHCRLTQVGMDGFTICPTVDGALDFLRCVIGDTSLTGWSGNAAVSPGSMHLGMCLWLNTKPVFHGGSWWVLDDGPLDSQFVPVDLEQGHGTYQVPSLVAEYGNTLIGTNGHLNAFFAGVLTAGPGASLSPNNIGGMPAGAQHITRNNIAAVVASPYDWELVSGLGGNGDAHVSVFVHPSGVGLSAGQIDHDYDHLHRFGTFPAGETRDRLATVIDSGGIEQACADIAAIRANSGDLFEVNGSKGNPLFSTTPVWDVPDPTFRLLPRWTLQAGSPCATGGSTSLSGQGWPDVDVDGTEIAYPGYPWKGCMEPGVPAIEQQVGPLGPMPSGSA